MEKREETIMEAGRQLRSYLQLFRNRKNTSGNDGRGEKQSDSKYISKVKPTGLAHGLDLRIGKKRELSMTALRFWLEKLYMLEPFAEMGKNERRSYLDFRRENQRSGICYV